MKRVILTSNPYRDDNFKTARSALQILRDAGIDARLCLPFEVDKTFPLPKDLRFFSLDRELQNAELVICFGGDGTILHMAKAATRAGLPLLGIVPEDSDVMLAATCQKPLLCYTKKGAAAACKRIANRIKGYQTPIRL